MIVQVAQMSCLLPSAVLQRRCPKKFPPLRVQAPAVGAFCWSSSLAKTAGDISAKWIFWSKYRCLKADLKYLAGAGTAESGKNQLRGHEVFLDCDDSAGLFFHVPTAVCRCSCSCLAEHAKCEAWCRNQGSPRSRCHPKEVKFSIALKRYESELAAFQFESDFELYFPNVKVLRSFTKVFRCLSGYA